MKATAHVYVCKWCNSNRVMMELHVHPNHLGAPIEVDDLEIMHHIAWCEGCHKQTELVRVGDDQQPKADSSESYHCTKCGGKNIEIRSEFNPNYQKSTVDMDILLDCCELTWCFDCEADTDVIRGSDRRLEATILKALHKTDDSAASPED